MEFCPSCANLLQYELPHRDRPSRFYCPTCPYVCNIESKIKIKRKQRLIRKDIEPVFSEEERRNGPETDGVTCPHCGHGKAIYHQAQIRSADEPMTTFFWCLNERCARTWRED